METTKILDLENNGVCIAADEQFLYTGCKGVLGKYCLDNMSRAACIKIKDVKKKKTVYNALWFSVFDDYIFIHDFYDLHIVQKSDLQLLYTVRLGENMSSDICGMLAYSAPNAYVKIRKGRVDVLDIYTKKATRYEVSDGSIWSQCVVGNRIFCGTAKGELLEIDRDTMQVIRKTQFYKKMAIYSVTFHNNKLYTASERIITVVDANTFEIVPVDLQTDEARALGLHVGKFQTTEANIIGICNNAFVAAERETVALFDTKTLQLRDRFTFPTGYLHQRLVVKW